MRMNEIGRTLAALALTGCCFGGTSAPTDPNAPPAVAPVVQGTAPTGTVPGTAPTVIGGTTTVTLAPGFMPDPNVTTGVAGGPVSASTLNVACRGSIPVAPSLVLNASAAFTNLRVMVNSPGNDTTLVIRHPDGTFSCDDDTAGNRNPIVQGPLAAGPHQIWVGVFAGGPSVPFTLGFSELPSVTNDMLAAPSAPQQQPVAAPPAMPISLAPGFLPDPRTASGRAGGPIEASTLSPDCRGFIGTAPNHILLATAPFANLRVLASAVSDTTLVIRRPDGTLACNDDSDGFNPVVQGAFPPGTYSIYVGTYSAASAGAPYNLGITEMPTVTAASLGTPPAQ